MEAVLPMAPRPVHEGARRSLSRRRAATTLLLIAGLFAASTVHAAPEKVEGGIRFSFRDEGARSVAWAGQFNNWSASANPMTKSAEGVWTVVLPLPAGEHEYKFVVDGQWIADPENSVTHGDFGNSLVKVGSDGALIAATGTSNTIYSPKILLGGRIVGLYLLGRNHETHRYELSSPTLDVGLGFDVRISDLMKARVILNTGNAVGTMRFDRGSLDFNQPRFQMHAFLNEGVATWDDPLHLVGNVGIYHYRFGYDRQGFLFKTQYGGFESEAFYADQSDLGGTTFPATPDSTSTSPELIAQFHSVARGDHYEAVPGASGLFRINVSDGNENVLALRTRRQITPGLRLGLLARNDRGFDLGTTNLFEVTGPDRMRRMLGTFDEEWWAAGGEFDWRGPHRFELFGEVLAGNRRLNPITASVTEYQITAVDSSGIVSYRPTAFGLEASNRSLDRSGRLRLGATWSEAHGDIRLAADVERETHDYRLLFDGIENAMTTWRLRWDRNWRYYVNREVWTGVSMEFTDFDYDPATPWNRQLWFPEGNFWLEHGEHVVSVDRLVMLGGNNVMSVKPRLEVPLLLRRHMMFRFRGTYNMDELGRLPKYAESVFQFETDVTPSLRFSTDSRWVKYDVPLIGLFHGFVAHFAELDYRFAAGIDASLGFGVDPHIVYRLGFDEDTYINRDQFLFARGAHAAQAATDFFQFGKLLDEAERALSNARVIQVKGTVNF
jgi:hypothetical protein